MTSLDPRVNRLNRVDQSDPKTDLDQLETYEVFVQQKENRPYRHEGIVHAGDEETAFLFAKEQYSRRQTCTGIWVARTQNVFASGFTEDQQNAYDDFNCEGKGDISFQVFHLLKRGKQHIHAGEVFAKGQEEAFCVASHHFGDKQVFNIWIIQSDNLFSF